MPISQVCNFRSRNLDILIKRDYYLQRLALQRLAADQEKEAQELEEQEAETEVEEKEEGPFTGAKIFILTDLS